VTTYQRQGWKAAMNFRSWAVAGRGQTSPIGRLDAIADNLNTRPRATHYWPTSPEVFCANTVQFSQGLHFGSLTPVAHSVLKHPVLYTMTVEFHNPGRVERSTLRVAATPGLPQRQ
jgi:hypothetical protein